MAEENLMEVAWESTRMNAGALGRGFEADTGVRVTWGCKGGQMPRQYFFLGGGGLLS
jgi:hypothetical protein